MNSCLSNHVGCPPQSANPNDAMASGAFCGFYLSDLEYGVRAYHDHLRELLPVCTLDRPPPEGEMERVNADMLGRT